MKGEEQIFFTAIIYFILIASYQSTSAVIPASEQILAFLYLSSALVFHPIAIGSAGVPGEKYIEFQPIASKVVGNLILTHHAKNDFTFFINSFFHFIRADKKPISISQIRQGYYL